MSHHHFIFSAHTLQTTSPILESFLQERSAFCVFDWLRCSFKM